MSARKSFPKPKNGGGLINNDLKITTTYAESSGPNNDILPAMAGAKSSHRKINVKCLKSKHQGNANGQKDESSLSIAATIKQEDTSMDEPIPPVRNAKPNFSLVTKPFEIKLEKTPLSVLNARGLISQKVKRPKTTCTVPTDFSSNIIRSSFLPVANTITPTSPKEKPANKCLTKSNSMPSVRSSAASVMATKVAPIDNTGTCLLPINGQPPSSQTFIRNGKIQNPQPCFTPSSAVYTPETSTRKVSEPLTLESPKKTVLVSPNRLSPNDLRFRLCTKKTGDELSVDSGEKQSDEASEENLDSMSIHADDDDLLEDADSVGESLDSLGKHFSALNDKNESGKKKQQSLSKVAKNKRKCTEEKPASAKTRRLESAEKQKSEEVRGPPRVNRLHENDRTTNNNNLPYHARPGLSNGLRQEPLNNAQDSVLRDRSHPRFQGPQPRQQPLPRDSAASDSKNYDKNRNHLRENRDYPNYPPPHSNMMAWNQGYPPNPVLNPHPVLPQRPFQHPLPTHHPMWHNRPDFNGSNFPPPRPWGPPGVNHYRPNLDFNRQRSYEKNSIQDTPRRSSTSSVARPNSERRMPVPPIDTSRDNQDIALKMRNEQKLYDALKICIDTDDFGNCVPVCEEIIQQFERVDESYLLRLLEAFADEGKQKADAKAICFIFEEFRKARARIGFEKEHFKCAIDAFLKAEEIDGAISIILEMKSQGFKPNRTMLTLIKNGVFEFSVKDLNNFITFCDELDNQNLISERLVLEALKFVSPDELKAKTKSDKILSILKEMKPEVIQMHATQSLIIPLTPFETLMEKIKQAVPTGVVPAELLVELINCIETSDHALSVISVLQKIPKTILAQVGSNVWNEFLELSCIGPYENVQVANQIEGIMQDSKIEMRNKVAFLLVRCLLRNRLTRPAVLRLSQLEQNDLKDEDMTDETNSCLCEILQQSETSDVDNVDFADRVIRILIKCKRQPPENKLLHLLSCFKDTSNYQKIQEIIGELHSSNLRPSYEAYQLAFSALECWVENPEAVIELYAVMKRLYPERRLLATGNAPQSQCSFSSCSSIAETANDTNEANDDDKSEIISRPDRTRVVPESASNNGVCRYFLAGETCPRVDKCNFSHMLPAPSLVSPFERFASLTSGTLELSSSKSNIAEEVGKPDSGYLSSESSHQFFAPVRRPSIEVAPLNAEYEKFYNRMSFALKSGDFHSLYKLYTDMRNKNVNVDEQILMTIYRSFIGENPSNKFEDLLRLVKEEIRGVVAVEDETDDEDGPSQLDLLNDIDQENLGRLGVRLMINCNDKEDYCESYRILHLFHERNINYWMFGRSFDATIPHRSPCGITVMAVDICLKQDKPQTDGAMEVLRGANYGLPVDDDETLTADDSLNRTEILSKLLDMLIEEEKYELTIEVLQNCNDANNMLASALKRFTALLLRFSESDEVEKAGKVFKFMESERLIDSESLVAYLSCLARAERIIAARHVFIYGRSLGMYPTENVSTPYRLEVSSDLTRVEMLFVLEQHLVLNRTAMISKNNSILPLPSPLVIKFIEVKRQLDGVWNETIDAKEKMMIVLAQMMNPPLRTQDHGNQNSEIVVENASILHWHTCVPDVSKHRVNLEISFESRDTRRAVYKQPEASNIPQDATATIRNDMSTVPTIAHIVCSQVKLYLNDGRIEKGEGYNRCCRKLTKLYRKQRGNIAEQLSSEERRADVSKFVDNFFEQHDKFYELGTC